jgi:hypothetical protein
MHKRNVRRMSVVIAAALIGGIGASAPATAGSTGGTIAGRFIDSHGQPIGDAGVLIMDYNEGSSIAYGSTDDNGSYSVTDIPPGTYYVLYERGDLSIYSGGVTNYYDAQHVTLANGDTDTINVTSPPVGTVSGTLTDPDGNPAAGVSVSLSTAGWAQTDDVGHWSALVFTPAQVSVGYESANGLTQYSGANGGDQNFATNYPVANDATVTIDDRELATGMISGRYTDVHGQPAANAQVSLIYTDGSWSGETSTDADGDYQVSAFPGSYNVSFSNPDPDYRQQFAHGSLTQADAAVVAVTAGQDVVVNDSELATGTVTVTATNANSGKLISNFCAYVDGQEGCTTTGKAVVSNVRQGHQEVDIALSNRLYLYAQPVYAQVTAGQNVSVTEAFSPGEVVKSKVVDSATGKPIEGACVYVADGTSDPFFENSGSNCSDSAGNIAVGPLTPGHTYSLLVWAPRPSTYGDQWIGKNGRGTGLEHGAMVITASKGKTLTLANIQMDRAGSITGKVTSAVTGKALVGAGVGVNTFRPGSGDGGDIVNTDATGHYTLTNLGPYQWPVFSMAENYADVWSGGVGNRYQATTVQVTSGATATYNVAMKAGPILSGTALKADGTPIAGGGYIVVYDAASGDIMGFTWANGDGTFSLPVTGTQNIRVAYWFDEDTTGYNGWYGGPTSATATVFRMSVSGSTINILLQPGTGR